MRLKVVVLIGGARTRALIGVFLASVVLLAVAASGASADFGIESFDGSVTNADGSAFTEAGGHPYQAETTIMFNTATNSRGETTPGGSLRDVKIELPAGFIGNPTAVPACQESELVTLNCPIGSQVGLIKIFQAEGSQITEPLFSMVPPPGVPAEFGFVFLGATTHLLASVRETGDYGVDITTPEISESLPVIGTKVTLWGVPGDPSHDAVRDTTCFGEFCLPSGKSAGLGLNPKAFLTNPTACTPVGVGLETRLSADSWQEPGHYRETSFLSHESAPDQAVRVGPTGCADVPFTPSVGVQPTSRVAGAPTGLEVSIKVPQEGLESGAGTAQSAVKDVELQLPQGMSVSPSAASGLQACSEAQVGFQGVSDQSGADVFAEGQAQCPEASKIGTVQIKTPLLEESVSGAVYLAQQGTNPFGSLFALYVVAEAPKRGIRVKLAGKVEANPVTGQLTATFQDNPQLPFSELTVDLTSGARAPLVNPSSCGSYGAQSRLTSYSGASVSSASPFTVDQGCGAGGFAPSFVAGTTSNQAGAFSPFSVTFSRSDGEQALAGIRVQAPPGLLGKLAGVPLCAEAQANAGSCPAASQIGHVTVAAGAGTSPIYLPIAGQPQQPVYLTGPYKGAPFGLSVVVPAIAGPFNLGTVVVRAAIDIDPHTAQVTITSDPLPTILDGVPLQIKTVNVLVDRGGFMLNPTNCNVSSVKATITGAAGASAAAASSFQATNCTALAFRPTLTASTAGKASKAAGASLDVKVTSAADQANIGAVKVDLPKQLPSRLTTLQKACLAATFEANPAGCPVAANVGTAIAATPILAHPLSGPAYLVSHGGAAFPDLEIVLQGEGVTIVLDGKTDIKKGITSSTFSTVPDAPISSFELKLPTGYNSVLTSNVPQAKRFSLCGQTLDMPTAIIGQNGAVLKQTTKIAIGGCPKAEKAKKKAKKPAHSQVAAKNGRKA